MAKSSIQLRKKLQEKSAECELYKRKYMSALIELNKQILENLDAEKTFADGGFIDDDFTHDTIKTTKKLEEEKGFISRFMPNVKFAVPLDCTSTIWKAVLLMTNNSSKTGFQYFMVSSKGELIAAPSKITYDFWTEEEVSYYEAIPQLVPYGMVYDKESDSLVSKHKVPMIDECDFSHYDTEKYEAFLTRLAKMAPFPKKP